MMRLDLHPKTAERLVKLAGLFGSDAAGERATAAAMADRLLSECGLTWADVFSRPVQARQEPQGARRDHRSLARWALGQPSVTDWERRFLGSLIARLKPPTPKQLEILHGLVQRLEAAELRPERRA